MSTSVSYRSYYRRTAMLSYFRNLPEFIITFESGWMGFAGKGFWKYDELDVYQGLYALVIFSRKKST